MPADNSATVQRRSPVQVAIRSRRFGMGGERASLDLPWRNESRRTRRQARNQPWGR